MFFNNILDNTAASSPNAFGVTTLGLRLEVEVLQMREENSLPTSGDA